MLVVEQGVGGAAAKFEVDATNGHGHRRPTPGGGIALLAVDADLAGFSVRHLAAVLFDELLTLHEEAARAHGRVEHAALDGLQHFHNKRDDALGRVVLAALLAFGQRELAKEVFVDVAKDVFAFQSRRLAVVILAFCRSSKASDTYLRKIKPSTTCL